MTFRGRLLAPHDDGYDQARVVQNGLIDRRPALIVQCSGTADVIDAVNLAREQQLLTRCGPEDTASPATASAMTG
jgi:hypothetical protein